MRIKWVRIIIVIVLVGIGITAFILFSHQEADALTVSEVTAPGGLPGQPLRVEGKVSPGSIEWDNNTQIMSFSLTDDKESLHVVYKGVVPDNFKPGAEMIVEGRYDADGPFQAQRFGSRRSLCTLCH